MLNLYDKLSNQLKNISFSSLWPGFTPYEFAIYNEDTVCLNGELLPRDERFIGNAAIKYGDRYIAILDITKRDLSDLDELIINIVHEMFHAYQYTSNESRWPNELQGLNYQFTSENMHIKYNENQLIYELFHEFNEEKWCEFLNLRHYRKTQYPNEFEYETKVEVIEGMAHLVELRTLKQLNEQKYLDQIQDNLNYLKSYCNLIPMRVISEVVGAFILLIAEINNMDYAHIIGSTDETIFDMVAKPYAIDLKTPSYEIIEELDEFVGQFYRQHLMMIHSIIEESTEHISGQFKLYGFNPTKTVKLNNYLYCEHYLAYSEKNKVHLLKQPSVALLDSMNHVVEIYY